MARALRPLGLTLSLAKTPIATIAWDLRGLQLFVEFCQTTGRPLRGPGDISRALLED
jgi:hypothetical protein